MKISTDELFEMLSWKNEEEKQQNGRKEAAKLKYISIFFRPKETKAVWENCAKVIVEKTDTELSKYVIDMLTWLQDMNWPGAELIYNRILLMKSDTIYDDFLYCLKIAIQTEDNPWIFLTKSVANNTELMNILPKQQRLYLKNKN